MKRDVAIILLLNLLIVFNSKADPDEDYLNYLNVSYTYVTTKGGQSILVYSGFDGTEAQKAQWQYEFLAICPNVTVLDEATALYNCHNYAWYMVEGHSDGKYLMEAVKPFSHSLNLSKFWTNDAFEETSGSVYDKIVYYLSFDYSDDNITHSAVVSSVPGYYESKWGNWPLVRHLPDEVPPEYGTAKKYFKPIAPTPITGLILCSNGTGTIGVNVAASYTTSVPNSVLANTKNIEYIILNGKGDDAVDMGNAIINSQSEMGMNVSFKKQGNYEMRIRYLNKYNELLASYYFEPLVTN